MCNRRIWAAASAAVALVFAADAGTLEVKQAKNLSRSSDNADGYATVKDTTRKTQKAYTIKGRLNRDEIGKCKIVVAPAFASRNSAVNRITESYTVADTRFSFSYNQYKSKHARPEFVFQAAKVAEIPDGVEKFEFRYVTPVATFYEEKWEYIGDTSNGFTLKGIAVYLIKTDGDDVKVLKTFCNAGIKDPFSRMKKPPRKKSELPKWAMGNWNYRNEFDDLDWSVSRLEPLRR